MNVFTLEKNHSNVNIVRRSFLGEEVVESMNNVFTLAKKHRNFNTIRMFVLLPGFQKGRDIKAS
jgi:hypothetical protein